MNRTPPKKVGQVPVPLDPVFESPGAEAGWEEGTQLMTVTKDKEQVKIQVGSKVMEKRLTLAIQPYWRAAGP